MEERRPHYVGTAADLKSLLLKENSIEGDIAICQDTQEIFQYTSDNEWVPYTPESGLSLSLYDLNKSIISQFEPISKTDLLNFHKDVENYLKETNNRHYMLLCNEKRYYTILLRRDIGEPDFSTFGNAVVSLLNELKYQIIAIDKNKNHFEIWIKDENEEAFVFMLFPYDQGVVTFGR